MIKIRQTNEPAPVLERSLCCFSGVPGLAVDIQGNIYVADIGNNRIVKLVPDGSVSTSWSTPFVQGEIDVQVDENGVVWVNTDRKLNQYTTDGKFIRTFTSFDSLAEFAFGPGGGVVYVLNHHFGELNKYRADGTLITSWSFDGGRPVGIAVDSNGRVYVGVINEIRIYSPDGVLLGTVPGRTRGGKLRIDSNDHLYQTIGPKFLKFTASGEVLWEIASPTGQSLYGLALDAQGKIYVGESGGTDSKVHIFALGQPTQDTTPPVINNLTANPSQLWPPNHNMVNITVSATVTDNSDPSPTFAITNVASNEAVDGLGDGDTSPDWVITGNHTVQLRAERSGKGNGRVYTITVVASDASGNKSAATVTVTVPKSPGKS